MQFIKKSIQITFLILFLLFSANVFSQENDDFLNDSKSDTIKTETQHKEKKFKLFSFFKKKKKEKQENQDVEEDETEENFDEDNSDDTIEKPKRNFFKFFNIFKRKKHNDSISSDSISLSDTTAVATDSLSVKPDSTGGKGLTKPKRIMPGMWVKMNADEQDSLLRAWDAYDKEYYRKKFAPNKKDKEVALKKKRNVFEKIRYKRLKNKRFRLRKKLIYRQNRRYKNTLFYDRFNKSEASSGDSISEARRYKIVNKRYKRDAKREAVSKNKTVIKYDRKENRLRNRYELSDNEKMVLNKGKAMRLKGSEKQTFKRARRKQEKFTKKLLKLRKKRAFALQNKTVQNRMKKKRKKIERRDKERTKYLFNRKKKKKRNDEKHDSDEYPIKYPDKEK